MHAQNSMCCSCTGTVKAWLTLQTPSSGMFCLHDARVPSMQRSVVEGCSGLRHTWARSSSSVALWAFLNLSEISSQLSKEFVASLPGCCDVRVK